MALRHARQSDRVEEEELADDRVVLARVRIRRVPRGRAAGGYDLVRQLAGAIGRLEGDHDRLAQHFCRYFDDILMPVEEAGRKLMEDRDRAAAQNGRACGRERVFPYG